MKKREIRLKWKNRHTWKTEAIEKMMRDIDCWDKNAMAELMAMGYGYEQSLRLTPAWKAIRHEPMDRDECIEYLNECLHCKCVL